MSSITKGYFLLLILIMSGCSEPDKQVVSDDLKDEPLFRLIDASYSGLDFNNVLQENEVINHMSWEACYNGSGVAVGDLNNDDLPDLVFGGGQPHDAVYMNKGELIFENVSEISGIQNASGWTTGVNIQDVNQDGLNDIYLCRFSHHNDGENVDTNANVLWINQGNATFVNQAKEYGLADFGYSIQSLFIDFDLDGDLDVYIVNQPSNNRKQKAVYAAMNAHQYFFSDHLYENKGNGIYEDITRQAGIENYHYGLNALANDVNNDGYPDIFVSSDYDMPDLLWVNNGDGTFTEQSKRYFKHISFYSMGSDFGDINNDGLHDLIVADMSAGDHIRSKTNMGSMSTKSFWKNVSDGKHFQYMFNALHLNTGKGFWSEIAQLSGIAQTDWSWSVLCADYNLDGFNDIFITNGVKRDMRNNDLIEEVKKEIDKNKGKLDLVKISQMTPSNPIANHLFINQGDFTFQDKTEQWGMNQPSFSHGAIYADLDRDGDLDIVTNNMDQQAFLYENVNPENNNYINISIRGKNDNIKALGTEIIVFNEFGKQSKRIEKTKGFLSSVEASVTFGLGKTKQIDSILIKLPNGKVILDYDVAVNQIREYAVELAESRPTRVEQNRTFFQDFTKNSGVKFRHKENEYDDFVEQILLPHSHSKKGPYMSKGDCNQDGDEDFFIGGANGQSGALFIQADGKFKRNDIFLLDDILHEDMGSTFFDFDNDGDLDLYVCSGGGERDQSESFYYDRLYENIGNGNFRKTINVLPQIATNSIVVVANDYDQDGDQDLFIGSGATPDRYPMCDASYVLTNESGKYLRLDNKINKELTTLGIVNDAIWTDIDQDKDFDLLIVGEWMEPILVKNIEGELQFENSLTRGNLVGWWNCIEAYDWNNDGKMDYLLGNLGTNSKFHVSEEHPLYIYAKDFDESKTFDIVLAKDYQNKKVPVRGRECSSQQMPFIEKKFPDYKSYAHASVEDIYETEHINNAVQFVANEFRSGWLLSGNEDEFVFQPLPILAQYAPIMGTSIIDVNNNGIMDIVCTGNHFDTEVETARYDASNGLVLLGIEEPNKTMECYFWEQSGFYTPMNSKDLLNIRSENQNLLIISNNNFVVQLFELNL